MPFEPSIRLPADLIEPGIHIDLRSSGEILVSRDGFMYESINKEQLEEELLRVKHEGSFVFFTRDHPEQPPPDSLMTTFEVIASAGVPIRIMQPPQ
ncbi:MAG TPA: hypothetical protein VLG74_03260 [Blastocatellia bacterium]|nr:hypothetical protein [Blastocatellia bacterium]